jgi:hypothetical protein
MSKVTAGERAHNWAQALGTLWPIILALVGGTVYGNSETVRNLIHGTTVEEADGQTEIVEGGMTFEQSVIKNSQEVRTELDSIKADIQKLQARSRNSDGSLQSQINKWHGNE